LVISLRVKLVAYFLVLSLLPLAAGAWAFASSLAGHERQRVDERLSAELRAAAAAAYGERAGGARPGVAAERLLRSLSARAGLAETDRLLIVSGSRVVAGPSAGRRFEVPTGENGTVELDGERVRIVEDLLAELREREPGDTVTVTVVRDSERRELRATLAQRE
jgi:S1-C subfamily serine protease